MEDIRDSRTQKQAEKFKRLEDHPMYNRMNGLGRGRLKRINFAATTKMMMSKQPSCAEVTPKPLKYTNK